MLHSLAVWAIADQWQCSQVLARTCEWNPGSRDRAIEWMVARLSQDEGFF
jgi:hypothetical protein